ncbi:MAG: homoserine dehydrogenase [Chloroflexota bacterium]|nr:homoserine dehydrogenase [Chloroflexota bacterium]
MERVDILLSGYGRVGQHFAGLVAERGDELRARHGVDLVIRGATDSRGCAVATAPEGLPLELLVAYGGDLYAFPELGRPGYGTLDALAEGGWRVLVETTPSDVTTGGAALGHLEAALGAGVDVVTAAKGPLVRRLAELRALGRERGARLKFGAAVAAALPTIDVAEAALTGARLREFGGILNGTTNFILGRMAETGCAYEVALGEAQARGIAEPDPALDVEGIDTATKLVILANALYGAEGAASLRLADVAATGITAVTPEEVAAAGAEGGALKLIGRCWREPGGIRATVRPERLPGDDLLAHVGGAEKAIVFRTDTMDRIFVGGGKSDLRGAAAALLRDVLNLYRTA